MAAFPFSLHTLDVIDVAMQTAAAFTKIFSKSEMSDSPEKYE